jgi:hypothetical protein
MHIPESSTGAGSQPSGLGLNINTALPKETIIDRQRNGIPRTMTPTRPAVEPLTPPAIASPKVHSTPAPNLGAAVETSSVAVKRPRSPEAIPTENGADTKKAKMDS